MWFFTPEGFFSAVVADTSFPDGRDDRGEQRIQIRARDRKDLDRLRGVWPALGPTIATPIGDYQFRAIIDRDAFAEGMASLAYGVNYRNFKSAVGRIDPKREHVYHDVWQACLAIGHTLHPRNVGGAFRQRRLPWPDDWRDR
jgi:hypothetical protein